MKETGHRCIRHVDVTKVVKNGRSKEGKQRYKCNDCGKTFLKSYAYNACKPSMNTWIKKLVVEGTGIRSISRLLEISPTTVLLRIKEISQRVSRPTMIMGKKYELDELCSYISQKKYQIWVAYAIRKDTKEVVDFVVDRRTKRTLRLVVNILLLANAKKIFTDRLMSYKYLIPQKLHSTKWRGTNGIERVNLNLRTHLKRLSRRTICYSKSASMLEASLRIYFWG